MLLAIAIARDGPTEAQWLRQVSCLNLGPEAAYLDPHTGITNPWIRDLPERLLIA